MKYSLLSLAALALGGCSHETTRSARATQGVERIISSTASFTCTGTISDGRDNTSHPTPIRLAFDSQARTLTVNGRMTVPLSFGNFNGAGPSYQQELILIAKGDGSRPDRQASWEERIRAWGLTITVRDQNPNPENQIPTGFYVGQGDFLWGGQATCPNWRSGIPPENFGD